MKLWIYVPHLEKSRLVREKAAKLGISEGEAYRLCAVEYETGIKLDTVTAQTQNAYAVWKSEAPRKESEHEVQTRKMREALAESKAWAVHRRMLSEMRGEPTVKERIEEKHGKGSWEKATRSVEAMEEEKRWKMPKIPTLPLGEVGADIKKSAQMTGMVIMIFVALLVYLIFVRGKGGEGVTIGSVG